MQKAEVKKEFIKRYKYMYENATIILAPYMCKETEESRSEFIKKHSDISHMLGNDLLIILGSLPRALLLKLEAFLLSDIQMEKSEFYIELEQNKKDSDYLILVKKGVELLEQKNKLAKSTSSAEKLDLWKLLCIVSDFVDDQSSSLKNKEKKLLVLDEYFRVSRYKNDGKIWMSGRALDFSDMGNYENFSAIVSKNRRKPRRSTDDIGVKTGVFINFISKPSNHLDINFSILSEQEKQNIYLSYHDELPCDLEIVCYEEEYNKTLDSLRTIRPENSRYCGRTFVIDENRIFVDLNDFGYRYYQLCPHCGFIVNISEEILSKGVKNRIEQRCASDPSLFRKMYLCSELYNLNKKSIERKREKQGD